MPRWVASVPGGKNPFATARAPGGANQPGDVWFLARTTGGSARRQCTIQAGISLFFTVINAWTFSAPPGYLPDASARLDSESILVDASPPGASPHSRHRHPTH